MYILFFFSFNLIIQIYIYDMKLWISGMHWKADG